jgi:hypothetical protein
VLAIQQRWTEAEFVAEKKNDQSQDKAMRSFYQLMQDVLSRNSFTNSPISSL